MQRRNFLVGAAASVFAGHARAASTSEYDCVVYGVTASGILASVAAGRSGLRTLLISGPNSFGGMLAQGLSAGDLSTRAAVGSLPLEFYHRCGVAYGVAFEAQAEAHVAHRVFEDMIASADVHYRAVDVSRVDFDGNNISALRLSNADVVRIASHGAVVDASYEGDLMALANVRFTVGRESRSKYGEPKAGFGVSTRHIQTLDPYLYRDSGSLLPGIVPSTGQKIGSADKAVQSYTFRPTLCSDRANSTPFTAPSGYDESMFQIILRKNQENVAPKPLIPFGRTKDKYDVDLFDFPHASWNYPLGNAAMRANIYNRHKTYVRGVLYFLANNPLIPSNVRAYWKQYGYAKDEFSISGNFPTQMYIREARRMVAKTVLVQADTQTHTRKANPIGIGTHDLDCHPTQIIALGPETVNYEGELDPKDETKPYQIPYEIMVPDNVGNLLVTCCPSASHVAFCSLRVEPQYMMMGEAAGVTASLIKLHKTTAQHLGPTVSSALRQRGVPFVL
jgi:hypothetical protein